MRTPGRHAAPSAKPTRDDVRTAGVLIGLVIFLLTMWVGQLGLAGGASAAPSGQTGTAIADAPRDTLVVLREELAACQVDLMAATAAGARGARQRAQACIEDKTRSIAWLLSQPTPTPTPTTSPPTPTPPTTTSPPGSPPPTPTSPPTASPPETTTSPPIPSPTTTSPDPTPAGWPGPGNTGVPAGTTLTVYTGPCRITTPTTIDAKLISCDLDITVPGVTISRSSIGGTVHVDASTNQTTAWLTISDSLIDAGHHQYTGLGDGLFVATRLEVRGGNRGVLCAWRCTLQDSWVHGTYVESDWHASGARAERYSTFVHNTLACDWLIPTALDGGCSADLTGYPDFAAPHDWLIQGNLFVANPLGAAFCAYGGSSGGKPFSGDPLTGTNIVFRDNVFQRGATRQCAAYGPIDSFNAAKAGAVWSGNVWDDGGAVLPG